MPLSNSIPVLPEINYQHQCGCQYDRTLVTIRPEVRDGHYFLVVPRCLEKHTELVRVGDNSASSNTPKEDPLERSGRPRSNRG